MAQPKRNYVKLLFSTNAGMGEAIEKDLLSFSYTDNDVNEADEISISLKDDNGQWAKKWSPYGGEVITAILYSGDVVNGEKTVLKCGKFYVDEMSVRGTPRTFDMKAVSIPLNSAIRKKLKSKTFEKSSLFEIGKEITAGAGIKYTYHANDVPYDKVDQSRESDLKLLSRLCEDAGYHLKLTDQRIYIFNDQYYLNKAPRKKIALGTDDIMSWDFSATQSDTYRSCTVSYRDPKKKKTGEAGSNVIGLDAARSSRGNAAVVSYTYIDPLVEDENAQEYVMKKRAKSLEEAKRLAEAKLRKLNARSVTGNISIVGNTEMVAGIVLECRNFGAFDGSYVVEKSEHKLESGGYTTSLQLRLLQRRAK